MRFLTRNEQVICSSNYDTPAAMSLFPCINFSTYSNGGAFPRATPHLLAPTLVSATPFACLPYTCLTFLTVILPAFSARCPKLNLLICPDQKNKSFISIKLCTFVRVIKIVFNKHDSPSQTHSSPVLIRGEGPSPNRRALIPLHPQYSVVTFSEHLLTVPCIASVSVLPP
jgi:hypothetical protein